MVFVEHHYRMLLVSSRETFIKEVSALLQGSPYQTDRSRSASDARCKMLENPYDIIIVNAPLSDEFGSRLCIDASRNNGTIAGLFAANDTYEEIYAKASVHGVFVIHKPTSRILVTGSQRGRGSPICGKSGDGRGHHQKGCGADYY